VESLPHNSSTGPDHLLVNPAAGGGRAAELFPKLCAFAKERNWNLQVVMTDSPGDLAAKARQAAATGPKRIFVLGGDGTFQILLNALSNFPEIALGLIPAGGGNDLASSLGLPENPVHAAELLLRGTPCQLDAVCVRTSEGTQRLYCGGGGVGLDAEAARYASGAFRNLRGRLRYLLSAIPALSGFHAIQARIAIHTTEAQDLKLNALLVGVLNTPSYGAGLRLAPDAKTDDGFLDLVILEDLHLTEVLALLPSLWRHGHLNTDRVHRFRVRHVRIETETPRYFHADGEILGTTPVDISVVPHAVRVLRPSEPRR
jgi:diacylglycerol kinase (ATP)